MSNAGISRSGRVRKKSAKLMEMDDDGLPIVPPNFGKHNQNFPKPRKLSKMSDDSEPEKVSDSRKISPIKIPKASPSITMTLPVKKRHPNTSMSSISNLPPVAAAVAATATNKMPMSTPIQANRMKQQPINSRIGIIPTGSDSSTSSSSSTTSSSDSSESNNSDSDSEIGMGKMNVMAAKAKPRPNINAKPVIVKKENMVPIQASTPMNKVKPSSFFSPNAVGPLGLDDDDDESESESESEDSSDSEEDNKLKIVERTKKMPVPKMKKEPLPPKKMVPNSGVKRGKSSNSAINAAAAVLAGFKSANLAMHDDGSSNSNLDDFVPAKVIKDEKLEKTKKMMEKKPPKVKMGRKRKIRDKAPRPMTAYMLWCQNNRKKIVSQFPKMDFSTISKKMGQVWQSLQDKEKMAWKRKAKKLANKRLTFISTGKTSDPNLKILSQHILGGNSSLLNQQGDEGFSSANRLLGSTGNSLNSNILTGSSGTLGSGGTPETVRPVGTAPIDVAAHLKLLGESLSIIGQRLTEHEGQIAVSGSLSVLLDSTLCALAPLMCLTSQVKSLDGGCSIEVLGSVLDNVAYIMPGL